MDLSRPEPAMGGSYTSKLGGKVIRITNVVKTTGKVGVQVPMYSTIPAWNADESYLILYQSQGYSSSGLSSSWNLYNGKTYKFIRELNIGAADVEDVYWSSTDPDIFYYITDYGVPASNYGPVLVKYSVSKGASTVVHSFAANLPAAAQKTKVDFGHILYMNWANTLVGIRSIVNGNTQSILSQSYNIPSGIENGWQPYKGGDDYQGLQIAPTGKVAIIGSKVVDPVTQKFLRKMATNTEEHGALGVLVNGDDAWISSQYDAGRNNGNIIVEDLEKGTVKSIIGKGNGWHYPPVTTHISTTAFKNQGWVGVSIVGNPTGQGLLDSTLLLANVNTGVVCAVAHTHSNGSAPPQAGIQGYWAEPHVVISPSGTRLLFGSDWENGKTLKGATNSVDSFVVELPSYKP